MQKFENKVIGTFEGKGKEKNGPGPFSVSTQSLRLLPHDYTGPLDAAQEAQGGSSIG